MSKITKKGPKAPAYFQDFIDNMFIPLVNKVNEIDLNQKVDHKLLMEDHKLLMEDHKLLMKVKKNQDEDHKLLMKVIKLNNLKTE